MEEILNAILDKLNNLEKGQAKLEQGQAKLEQGQAKLEQGQAKLEQGQQRIEQVLDRIEKSQQEDIVGMLNVISNKVDNVATKEDITFLSAKLGVQELEIDRLKRIR